MTKQQLCGVPVRDFMRTTLSLSGTALYVYALIYSFTAYGSGYFWGTRAYIANRVGVSLSSVDRALRKLTNGGFIIKALDRHLRFTTSVYMANLDILGGEISENILDTASEAQIPEEEQIYKEAPPEKSHSDTDRAKNDALYGTIHEIEEALQEKWRSMSERGRELLSARPPNTVGFVNICKERLSDIERNKPIDYGDTVEIYMTKNQYEYLVRRFGDMAVRNYIMRLEDYIMKYPRRTIRGHFATLHRWLCEDMTINVDKNRGYTFADSSFLRD